MHDAKAGLQKVCCYFIFISGLVSKQATIHRKNRVKAIFCAAALLPMICFGQASKLEVAVAIPLFLKVNEDINSQAKSSLLGATGIDLAIKVNGADENAMSFLQIIGLVDDIRSFETEPGSRIKTGLFFININPSVLVKTRWDNLKFSIGMGGLINIGESLESSTTTQSSGRYYTSIDSIEQVFKNNSRGLIPYISLGVMWNIRKHLKAQLLVEPTLLNFYEPDTKITYTINYSLRNFALSYQPVYFGIRLFYFF